MRCPFCTAADTRVVDSRLGAEGDTIRRRRECPSCNERFTTYEVAELCLPRVVKSDGSREPFIQEKLRTGLTRALEKRPVATEAVDAAVERIKGRLVRSGEREIASRRLGDLVMKALKDLDHVAYIRFASVYLSFEDLDAFRELISKLEASNEPL